MTGARGRRRRVAAGAAVAVVLAGVVAVSRAGLDDQRVAPPATGPTAVNGVVVELAADSAVVGAVVESCQDSGGSCAHSVLISRDNGVTWQRRGLPGSGPPTDKSSPWRMTVSGSTMQVEDPHTGSVYYSGDAGRTLLDRPVRKGAPVARVPDDLVDAVFLCRPPQCTAAGLAYVDGASGQRHRLSAPVPFTADVVRSEAGSLWIAGVESHRGHYATAVSRDGGASWRTTVLTAAKVDKGLSLDVVPIPGRSSAYFISGYESDQRLSVYGVWFISDPTSSRGPLQVTPDRSLTFGNGIGVENGLLLFSDGFAPFTLSPAGTVTSPTRTTSDDLVVVRKLVRGQRGFLASSYTTTAASIAVTATGGPDDWQVQHLST